MNKGDLVTYEEIAFEDGKKYRISMTEGLENVDRFYWTVHNLNKMFLEHHPIVVVNPSKNLTKEEMEDYRKFFCSYAKKVRKNMIYFPGPVIVEEINDLL